MMDTSLRVDPEHFEYLRIQKGNLDRFAHDRFDWMIRYQADIRATYEEIAPYLPKSCGAFLDVGSGLGGIDVLIRRHYEERGQSPMVALLDGVDDPPVMNLHRETFNNMRMARNFQVKNGCPPPKLEAYGPDVREFDRLFDLVVSFGSWCFHFPPDLYLPQVARALAPGALLMLEVRRDKPAWVAQLAGCLELVRELKLRPKWSRCLFRRPPT